MQDELTYASAGAITKASKEADGVWSFEVSKATGPELDSDKQILDLDWAKGAMKDWFETGANVREQHDPHRVVGKALVLETRDDGAWIGGKVVDDQAGRKLEHGLFNGLSVGVRGAIIDRSKAALAKAAGGIVKGGQIVEVSLVDRPSNPTAKLVMAKADGAGNAEFVEELTEKAESVQHSHSHHHSEGHHRHQHTHGPDVAEHRSLDSDVRHAHDHTDEQCESLMPDDDMKAIVAELEKAKLSTQERKDLDESDFALPESREYPIQDEDHARAALMLLHNASPEDQKKIRAAIHRKYPNIDMAEKAAGSVSPLSINDMRKSLGFAPFEMPEAYAPFVVTATGVAFIGKAAKPKFDPDDDGDDDSTPEGDTDHDYWNEDGTPTEKGKKAGFTAKEGKEDLEDAKEKTLAPDLVKSLTSDPEMVEMLRDALGVQPQSDLLQKIADLEAGLEKALNVPGVVRSRPPQAARASAEADKLRVDIARYELLSRESTDPTAIRGYSEMAKQAEAELQKLAR